MSGNSKALREMFEGISSFQNIGTLNAYLQQKKLRFAANYKAKTGQRLTDAVKSMNSSVVNSMMSSTRKADDEASKQRVSLIKQKLMSGKKVSSTEIEYLRERDPSLYRKAKKAQEYREELQAKLRACKTKQEARMAVAQSMVKAAAEISEELSAAKAATGGTGGSAASAAGFSEPGGNTSSQAFGSAGAESGANVSGDASAANANAETMDAAAGDGLSADANAQNGGSANAEAANAENGSSAAAEPAGKVEEAGQTEHATDAKGTDDKTSPQLSPMDAAGQDNSPDSILEKFIMIVRALQDEWETFSGSEEYKDLPEDYAEEAEERKRGKKHQVKVEAPGRKILDMVNAYKDTQIHMKEFELEMSKLRKVSVTANK